MMKVAFRKTGRGINGEAKFLFAAREQSPNVKGVLDRTYCMKEFEQFSRMVANYNSDVSIYVSRRGKFGLNISSHTLHTSNYKSIL